MYWINVATDRGWLQATVGRCQNLQNADWTDVMVPEPPGPRNECTDGTHRCSDLAFCSDNDQSYSCTCKPEFTGTGFECTYEDECTHGTHNCMGNSHCQNTPGSFKCICDPGFTGDGTVCENLNECECSDINQCNHNCSQNANCYDTQGSYYCKCHNGFSGDGVACTPDINCNQGCSEDANCINNVCECKGGFRGNGKYCYDINECLEGKDNCSQNAYCNNLIGSFECTCEREYYGDGYNCTNLVSCTVKCSPYAECINDVCSCRPGFEGNGAICFNIDECITGTDTCSPYARCLDLIGSFRCECNDGFLGNGLSCTPAVVCPSGSFLSTKASCLQCPVNTYSGNDRNTFSKCISCPLGYVTQGIGSTSASQCLCKSFNNHYLPHVATQRKV